jgi:hypothetical protein
MRAFRKSSGTLCTAPGEMAFLVMNFILHRYAISLGSPRMLSELGAPFSRVLWISPTEHPISSAISCTVRSDKRRTATVSSWREWLPAPLYALTVALDGLTPTVSRVLSRPALDQRRNH